MKKEELDKLRAKFLEGKTSLDEERKLKEQEEDTFFGMLKPTEEQMDWSFDSFMEDVETAEKQEVRIVPMRKRIISLISIAASLVLGFFLLRPIFEESKPVESTELTNVAPKEQAMDVQKPAEVYKATEEVKTPVVQEQKETPLNRPILASNRKKAKEVHKAEAVNAQQVNEDELYVEINGVRIYDEDKALEVTEAALHLASSNLKKGMEGVEYIKHLKIEI